MLDHEKEKLESIKLDYDKYWVPINWSYTLFFEARRAEKIASDAMTNKLCDVSFFLLIWDHFIHLFRIEMMERNFDKYELWGTKMMCTRIEFSFQVFEFLIRWRLFTPSRTLRAHFFSLCFTTT